MVSFRNMVVDLKEAGAPTENLLFKLELITNLISQFFVASGPYIIMYENKPP
jgi:hypothetical protein